MPHTIKLRKRRAAKQQITFRQTLIDFDEPLGRYALTLYATSVDGSLLCEDLSPETRRELSDLIYSALKGAARCIEGEVSESRNALS